MTHEVAGALERPSDTRIEITESAGSAIVAIPVPRMPIAVYLYIIWAVIGVALLFFAGLSLFVLNRPLPIITPLVGEYRAIPTLWRIIALTGWATMVTAGVVILGVALRPMTRREEIVFGPLQVSRLERTFLKTNRESFPRADVARFHLRRDRQGLLESSLVMSLAMPSESGGDTEIPVALSTTEAEKQWLASVLNVLLERYGRV